MSAGRLETVAEALASAAACAAATVLLVAGCAAPKQDAKALFAQAVAQHQRGHFAQAAAGYQKLLRDYRDQPYWCAQALRSLGNVRAAQGKLDEAVKLYDRVAAQYPGNDWDVLQAWKSAADLLWEAGHHERAKIYDAKIIAKYGGAQEPAITELIVRTSKTRLAGH
jgi:tetratricopeptide (TPR) repeat protein